MSAFNLIAIFCLGIAFICVVSVDACATTVKGFTWDFNADEDELIPGTDSADACYADCGQDDGCKGYTYTLDEVVGSYCYKFKQLGEIHSCHNCTSGTIPDNLEGTCTDDILAVEKADSTDECMELCSDTLGCNAYTWWGSSSIHPNVCFLYESCQNQMPCEGCTSARLNCISYLPNHCYDYKVLDEADRSIENTEYCFDNDSCYSDNLSQENDVLDCSKFSTSIGWKGRGMYRFMEPAGLMLPEYSPGLFHCGTAGSLYLDGQHPQQIGEEIDMQVGFDKSGIKYNVSVTNCGDFYIYLLPEVDCINRYCATSFN